MSTQCEMIVGRKPNGSKKIFRCECNATKTITHGNGQKKRVCSIHAEDLPLPSKTHPKVKAAKKIVGSIPMPGVLAMRQFAGELSNLGR